MPRLRAAIAAQIRGLVSSGPPDGTLEAARTDVGLFGPDSACWRVHGDFTSMMTGGVSALLLQMLHPGALAGVWDHSNFRQDMSGRLRRTAQFVAGVTYGSHAEALRWIARVRAVHDQVSGRLPDGSAYSANDPELLTWVHVAEATSFLAAYLRYRDPAFAAADQDRYFAETAEIARLLGAVEVPQSRAEARAYLESMRPKLRCDARTREVARTLLAHPPPSAVAAPFMHLVFEAALDLLPAWALHMHGLRLSPARRSAARLGVTAIGPVVRWALVNTAEARARRRSAELQSRSSNSG